jgi:alkylated DNA repair dioxygenase AlkB
MERLQIPQAEVYYDAQFLSLEESDSLLETLLSRGDWQRRKGMFGHQVPREEAYYGDVGTHYTYSRREYQPLPWIPELLSLKQRVEEATPLAAYTNLGLPRTGYNAVLCNLYRDGKDSVGLHADAEPEMGPIIASMSLGAERLFRMRGSDGGVAFSKKLPHGSLLIMAGETQRNFRHEVPKAAGVRDPRINLTFRRVARK